LPEDIERIELIENLLKKLNWLISTKE
jgi:hypothetical protein